ncbi:MAG: hypothetical protein PF795_04825 [Kiritimatiellae bacterium]|nr:hypothetical protein [Kiritimatiellia bacterium]
MPNAIWLAGVIDGGPPDLGENGNPDADGMMAGANSVRHITNPAELPSFIAPSQRLVLHLPGFPPGSYRVSVATTGGSSETLKEEYLDREKFFHRSLTVRWNDHLIWQRWQPPVFSIARAAVPPLSLSAESNLLVLENSGTQVLLLDAVWVDPVPDEGVPFYASLEDAHWLNRGDSGWVRNTRLILTLPTTETSWETPKNIQAISPPKTVEGLPDAWQETLARYRHLGEEYPELAEAFRPWMWKAAQAVSRGMMPSVEIRAESGNSTNDSFHVVAFIFGGLFHNWFLSGNLATTESLAMLRELSPGGQIITSRPRSEADSHTVVRFPQSFSGLLQEHSTSYRQYFDGKLNLAELNTALSATLTLRGLFRGYAWSTQSYHSDEFFSAAGDYLMVNDRPLVVHGGFPGSPFFPAGDDTPGLMWHYLKPLFRFGGPDHFKGVANLTPDSPGSGIERSSWAVASNGRDSVQVLVRNHIGLNDRRVNLELPVPWTGPTRVLHHSVRSAWSSTEIPENKLARRVVEAVGDGQTGWIRIPFGLQGIQMFELAPEHVHSPRRIQAPEKIGFSELQEVKTLFDVSRQAPPPWWSRIQMGAHFFAYWRYSGDVSLEVDVAATRDRVPDWAPFKAIHIALPEEVKAVSPLRDTSTKFHFGDPVENVARILRAGYNSRSTYKGERMGIWLRVHPPPGFQRKFDAFNAIPRTKFYMGKLPYRQLIDVEYGTWYFISSDAKLWRQSVSKYNPYLMFWPADPVDGNPVIEVNAFEMYQVKLEDGDITPEKCMGFIQRDSNGNLLVLVLGVPGKPAFWRQRLTNLIDVNRLKHAVDKELLTTADTTEEDPPELVRHRVRLLEDSKILEIEIDTMPPPPSPSHLRKIEKAYPLLQNVVANRGLGVFLMEMEEPAK